MKDVLDNLINQSDEGAVAAKIITTFGAFEGAVKRHDPVDDHYEMLCALQEKDPRSGAVDLKMSRLYFRGEDLRAVLVPAPDEEPRIARPKNGGIHIPGRS